MDKDRKKISYISLSILFVLIALSVKFFIGGNNCKTNEKLHMYLPIYEFKSAADGSLVYNNNFESDIGFIKQKLSKLVTCQHDYCKWVYSDYSTFVNAAWVMYDVSYNESYEGGYYFYDHINDKIIEGPFTDIKFEKPIIQSEVSRKIIVTKEKGYGLYDLVDMKYILELDCDYMDFGGDGNHIEVYNVKENKITTYLIEGDSYIIVSEKEIPEGEKEQ